MRTTIPVLSGLLLAASVATCSADSIWIEGEDAKTKQITRHRWYDGVKKVFAGKDVLGQALSTEGWDAKELTGRLTTSPTTLAMGRVTIGFGKESKTTTADLAPYHDKAAKELKSTTNELLWRYGDRRVEVRSAKTQAIIGFVGGGQVKLPGVQAAIKTPFVSLIFTPLDNAPLADSRRILITALARDKQTGAEFNADWSKLLQVGGPPLLLEPVEATLLLSGSVPARVTPLDGYGIPTAMSVPIGADGSFAIDGRYQAYYYEVKR